LLQGAARGEWLLFLEKCCNVVKGYLVIVVRISFSAFKFQQTAAIVQVREKILQGVRVFSIINSF